LRAESLDIAASDGSHVPTPVDGQGWRINGMIIGKRKTDMLGEKPAPVPLVHQE
jgi:hypothetical protein